MNSSSVSEGQVKAAIAEVTQLLHGLGVQGNVAGGAVASLLYGLPVRDIDFCVYAFEYENQPFDVAVTLMDYLGEDAVQVLPTYEEEEGVQSDRVWCVVKFVWEGVPVDIIWYTNDFDDMKGLVASFDCTINWCWSDGNATFLHPEHPYLVHMEDQYLLAPVRWGRSFDITAERVAHLREKFKTVPNLCWMEYDPTLFSNLRDLVPDPPTVTRSF